MICNRILYSNHSSVAFMAKLVRGYRAGRLKAKNDHPLSEAYCMNMLRVSINSSLYEAANCGDDLILKLRILRNAVSILGPNHPLTAQAAKSLADDAQRLAAKNAIAA